MLLILSKVEPEKIKINNECNKVISINSVFEILTNFSKKDKNSCLYLFISFDFRDAYFEIKQMLDEGKYNDYIAGLNSVFL